MTDIQTAPAVRVRTRFDASRRFQTAVHEIDESFFAHVSGEYWAWRELVERDDKAAINQHPDVALTDLRFSREPQHRMPVLITCQRSGKRVAAAVLVPKSIAGEKRFGPAWNLQGFRLAGNRIIGDQSPETQQAVLAAIRNHMTETRADFLLAEDVDNDGALLVAAEHPDVGLRTFRPAPPQRRHRIHLPESLDEYWQKFNSKSRNTLRRKVKQFGDCRLERITTPEQVSDFLAHAQTVAKNSWQSDLLGLRIHNDDFELQLFTELALLNALRCYLLWKDDAPVSFCIGTQYNGEFHYEEVGYHRDFSRKSPGQVLVIKMLEDMFAHDPPNVFDFGGGDAEYKRQFGNSISESGHIWLLRPGLRSRLIVGYLGGRRLLSVALRSALERTGLLERVRQWTRKGLARTSSAGE